jgi:hypothetical protein
MYRACLSSIVGLSRTHRAKETDMNDWKLSPMPIVMLRGWAFHEVPRRRESRRTTRRAIRFAANAFRGLVATGRRTSSREAFPQSDRRHLHSG